MTPEEAHARADERRKVKDRIDALIRDMEYEATMHPERREVLDRWADRLREVADA